MAKRFIAEKVLVSWWGLMLAVAIVDGIVHHWPAPPAATVAGRVTAASTARVTSR